MRTAFLMIFAFSIIISFVSYLILPDEVAIHFGFGGKPDSWASKEVNLIATVAIQLIVFLVCYIPLRFLDAIPARYINIPNKDYWLSPENLPAAKNKLNSLMPQFGIATYLLFNMVLILTVDANLSDPVQLKGSIFLIGLAIYAVFIVLWLIRCILSFRLPESRNNSTD